MQSVIIPPANYPEIVLADSALGKMLDELNAKAITITSVPWNDPAVFRERAEFAKGMLKVGADIEAARLAAGKPLRDRLDEINAAAKRVREVLDFQAQRVGKLVKDAQMESDRQIAEAKRQRRIEEERVEAERLRLEREAQAKADKEHADKVAEALRLHNLELDRIAAEKQEAADRAAVMGLDEDLPAFADETPAPVLVLPPPPPVMVAPLPIHIPTVFTPVPEKLTSGIRRKPQEYDVIVTDDAAVPIVWAGAMLRPVDLKLAKLLMKNNVKIPGLALVLVGEAGIASTGR